MLQVNFIMICIIYKILLLLKIIRILKCFLRSITDFYFVKKNFFSQHIMSTESRSLKNIIKYVRNLFRLEKLKKETIDTTI